MRYPDKHGSIDQNLKNPCNSPILNKTFKAAKNQQWTVMDKDVVDEIVSKIILRHSNLATTQRYLGKVSDNEAIYWVEIFTGNEIRGLKIFQSPLYFFSLLA